jgi:hypothetical protein
VRCGRAGGVLGPPLCFDHISLPTSATGTHSGETLSVTLRTMPAGFA